MDNKKGGGVKIYSSEFWVLSQKEVNGVSWVRMSEGGVKRDGETSGQG